MPEKGYFLPLETLKSVDPEKGLIGVSMKGGHIVVDGFRIRGSSLEISADDAARLCEAAGLSPVGEGLCENLTHIILGRKGAAVSFAYDGEERAYLNKHPATVKLVEETITGLAHICGLEISFFFAAPEYLYPPPKAEGVLNIIVGASPPGDMGVRARKAILIGAGSVGSWVALFLAKLGVSDIEAWDGDSVASHNTPMSLYGPRDIARPKVHALGEYLESLALVRVSGKARMYEDEALHGATIISCVDTMAATPPTRTPTWPPAPRSSSPSARGVPEARTRLL